MSNALPSATDKIDPIDRLIGRRVKFRRNVLGITQEALARELGLSFQQIQKYESGQNKIYASRLFHIAQVLKLSMEHFFEEEAPVTSGLSDQGQENFMHDDMMDKTETANLIRVYYDIKDKKKRKNVIEMMKDLQS